MDGGRTVGSLGRCGAFKCGLGAEPAPGTAAQLGMGRLPCSDGSGQSRKALEIRSPNHLKHTNRETAHGEDELGNSYLYSKQQEPTALT